jgi:hypothetical protein
VQILGRFTKNLDSAPLPFHGCGVISIANPLEHNQMEGEYSNGEDAEADDAGEDLEVDASARNEDACTINAIFCPFFID